MKFKTKVLTAAGAIALFSSPVLAATNLREDNSNVLVWAFLAICGLIIFLQMVPVLSLSYGLIKGIFGKKDGLEKEMEAATSKYR